MRLIDADKFKEFISKLPKYPNGHSKSYDEASIIHFIDSQSTAFDLESVIEQLEEKRDYCYSEMEKERNNTDYFSEHIFEENHNRAVAFCESIEILKSAVNATNGKNGG